MVSVAATATTTVSVVKADSNNDGKVNFLDFNALLVQWGKTGTNLVADFNHDGVVDFLDFNMLLINWSR